MQVIDYQNRPPNQRSPGDQLSFSSRCSAPPIITPDFFPRKVIEYDHKTKIYPWSWFCPIVQIEYNHTPTGFSLHEHPPPKPVEKRIEQPHFVKLEPKMEEAPLRHPKWQPQGSSDRPERFSYAAQQGERYYQSRYENRPNAAQNVQSSNDNYPYYRRNPQEKNWARNSREWNNSQGNYGYEK